MAERDSLAPRFALTCEGFREDAFFVTRWHGEERISQPYRLELTLASRDMACDLDALLGARAKFSLFVDEDHPRHYHGVVRRAEQFDSDDEYAYYRVVLMPRMAGLADFRYSEIHLDATLPDIIRTVMNACGLGVEAAGGGGAYDFRIAMTSQDSEATRANFICQFEEDCLAFLQRRLEREGVYYYFEQLDDQEAIIFCGGLPQQPSASVPMTYRPLSTKREERDIGAVERFSCEVSPVPKTLELRDFAGSHAALDLMVEEPVSAGRHGVAAYYGGHFGTAQEGRRLARLRAQSLAWRAKCFRGTSRAVALAAGYPAALSDHPLDHFNATYYMLEVRHDGGQPLPGRPTMGERASGGADPFDDYHNAFLAIPADVQFRPAISVAHPNVTAVLSAIVDGEGQGPYAQLNEHGAYKVRFPFDRKSRAAMHASAWLRMASPYAGAQHGMHFPLLKGTEVLVAFLNGDPDRPFIVAAVANSENPNVVVDANVMQNAIKTAGGNRIVLDDTNGGQSVHLASPVATSSIKLGAASQPGLALASDAHIQLDSSSYTRNVKGAYSERIIGPMAQAAGAAASANIGEKIIGSSFDLGAKGADNKGWFQGATNAGVIIKNYLGAATTSYEGSASNIYLGAYNSVHLGIGITLAVAGKIDTGLSGSLEFKSAKTRRLFKEEQNTSGEIETTFGIRKEAGDTDIANIQSLICNVGSYNLCAGMPLGAGACGLRMISESEGEGITKLVAGHSSLQLTEVGGVTEASISAQNVVLEGAATISIGDETTQEMSIAATTMKMTGNVDIFGEEFEVVAASIKFNGQLLTLG